jgi:hypothetical protein
VDMPGSARDETPASQFSRTAHQDYFMVASLLLSCEKKISDVIALTLSTPSINPDEVSGTHRCFIGDGRGRRE